MFNIIKYILYLTLVKYLQTRKKSTYCEILPKIASEIHIISGNRNKYVSFLLVIREAAQYNSPTEEDLDTGPL